MGKKVLGQIRVPGGLSVDIYLSKGSRAVLGGDFDSSTAKDVCGRGKKISLHNTHSKEGRMNSYSKSSRRGGGSYDVGKGLSLLLPPAKEREEKGKVLILNPT